MTMVNMARLLKMIDPDYRVEAVIPYHHFLAQMDVREFLDEFDEVWHLPTCDFQRNILQGVLRGRAFKRALRNIRFRQHSIFFAFISVEMSVNLAIQFISERLKPAKIILLTYAKKQIEITKFGGRLSRLLTALNQFYSFVLGCYPMRSYVSASGQFMYREHVSALPFPRVALLENPCCGNEARKADAAAPMALPYPVIARRKEDQTAAPKKFVLFFGDASMAGFFTQLNGEFLYEKTAQYAKAIKDYYGKKNIPVFYKPHPFDGEKIMPGCEGAGFDFFKEKINAEMTFSKYHDRLAAVYTVSSHSVLFGSKNGIPSYWAFELCFSDEDLKKSFREVTVQCESRLLKSLKSLDEIGSFDDDKRQIDEKELIKAWETGMLALME